MPFTVPATPSEAVAALQELRVREAAVNTLWECKRELDDECKRQSAEADGLKHVLLEFAKAQGGDMLVSIGGGVVADIRPPSTAGFGTGGFIAFRTLVNREESK